MTMIVHDLLDEASRHYREGRLDEAVSRYQEILDNHPAHHDALYGLALARFQQNELCKGQALLEKLLEIEPRHMDGHRQLALVHRRLGRDAEALASFDRALAL